LPSFLSFIPYNNFQKQKSKEEIDKYLAEAKAAVKGSKVKGSKVKGSKNEKLLFEAVENLQMH